MLPIKQNLDSRFTTNLKGVCLPLHCLYGNISGTFYYCYDFEYHNGYNIMVFEGTKFVRCNTKKYRNIERYICNFINGTDFVDAPIKWCAGKSAQKKADYRAGKRAEAFHSRVIEREWAEIGRPQEKRPQSDYLYRAHRINGLAGCIESASNAGWEKEKSTVGYNGITPDENLRNRGLQPFEMGQTTSGTVDGKYTRSGFEVKKDGCMTMVEAAKKARQEKVSSTVHFSGKNWKGDSFQCERRGNANSMPPKPVWQQVEEENQKKCMEK